MINHNLDYYGYDKSVYQSVDDLRKQTIRRHTEILVAMFLVMMLGFSLLSVFNVINYLHRYMYFFYLFLGVVFQLILIIFKKYTAKYPTFFMYLAMAMLVAFAIASSDKETFKVSTIFPAFTILLSVAFIDRMIRFSALTILSCALFINSAYVHKPPSIARYDLIYGIVFLIIGLMFHFLFQRNRINQFLIYYKNLEIQRDLEIRSSFDALSSLLIRARFFAMANSVLRSRIEGQYAALCILDLDSFKQINDRYGHQMGDKVIQTAGNVIWDELNVNITEKWSFCENAIKNHLSFAGRLGGDEFVIFIIDDGGWSAVYEVLRHILNSLNNTEIGGLRGIHASFGVTELDPSDSDIDEVYNRADEALYKAKTSGKNQIIRS